MARPTVRKQIERPGGGSGARVKGRLRLIAAVEGEAFGYAGAVAVDVGGVHEVTADSTGLLSFTNVRPNSGASADAITSPIGTAYELVVTFPDHRHTVEYIDVPDATGPFWVKDLLTDPPEDLVPIDVVTPAQLVAALTSYLPATQKAQPSGVASLDGSGKVPSGQLPDLAGTYLPIAQKAAANGVASLGSDSKVPAGQLPDLAGTYLPLTQKAAPSGVASLDSGGLVPLAQLARAQRLHMLDVRDYGAVGDGVTDDSAAFQAAMSAATAGSTITAPPGTYSIRNITGNKDGITVEGVRGKTVLLYRASGAASGHAMFTWNHTTAPGANNKGITFRDLTFQGTGSTLTSYLQLEHQYLLQLSAVTNVLVDNCDFLDFQGDAIYLGRTTSGGVDSGVHNYRVTIRDSYFYGGTTYYNRDGLSVIDCTSLEVRGCTFENCGTAGIDIEPNLWDTSAILKAVTVVDNVFINNGITGDFSLAIVPTTAVDISGWKLSGNRHFGCRGQAYTLKWNAHPSGSTDPYMGITLHDAQVYAADASATDMAVVLEGVRGVVFDACHFQGWPYGAIRAGYDNTRTVRDIKIRDSTFVDCGGSLAQYSVMFNTADGLQISGCHVQRTSGTQTAFVVMQTGPVNNVLMRDNTCDGTVNVAASIGAATGTYSNNWAWNNKIGFTSTVPEPNTFFGRVEKFGPQRPQVRTVNYNVNRDDDVVVMNGTSLTASLPDPLTAAQGRRYTVININASALTVNSQGTSRLIGGAASVSLAQYGHLTVVTSDNTNWYTVA